MSEQTDNCVIDEKDVMISVCNAMQAVASLMDELHLILSPLGKFISHIDWGATERKWRNRGRNGMSLPIVFKPESEDKKQDGLA